MTRATLFMCALALAACDDDTGTTTPTPMDLAVPDLAGSSCGASTCAACPSGTACVTMTSGPTPFGATCLASCQTSTDCTGGRDCVNFAGYPPAQRFCVNSMEPNPCGTTFCELTPPTHYCEGDDLVSNYQHVVCGLKYTHCANGCVEDAPDGGLDRQARCS
jgi:hypothetical protein